MYGQDYRREEDRVTGDKISGDKISGDKISGDQVAGNQVTVNDGQGMQVNQPQAPVIQTGDHATINIHSSLQRSVADTDFQRYLTAIAKTYEKWQELYTLTDAESRQRQQQEPPPFFDFGLMVQTVVKPEPELGGRSGPEKEREQEKVERFSVLDGLHKYALGEKPEPVLLVGRPGSGKSTALARLMLEEATQKSEVFQKSEVLKTSDFSNHALRIPVLVELRYWQGSIAQLILDALNRHDLCIKPEQLEEVLAKSLLLFDGVNELPSDPARTQLIDFRRNHAQLPMIFTTRDLGQREDLGIERKLEMLPLTEPQMQAFIRAYIPTQAEAILWQLKDRLREFGQTPLLLWMLCEVFKQSPTQQLPNNLGGIFQVFTRTYEDSSVRKHEVGVLKGDVKPLTDRRLWKKALMAIAALMMQGETPVDFRVAIHRDEAEQELSRIFPNEKFPVRDILDDLLKYHLLQNRSTDQIEFRHQLIQEYYAAEYLLKLLPNLTDDQLKQDYLNYLKWTEPLALMLALVDSEAQVVRVVQQALAVDWRLGARLAGEVKPAFQEQTVALVIALDVPEWLKVELWGETRSDRVRPELLQALNNPNIEIARNAAVFVGSTSNQAVIDLLTNKLEEIDSSFFAQSSFQDPDPTGMIWTTHVEALAYTAPQNAVEFLRRKLRDPRSRRILIFCTQAPGLLMKLDTEAFLLELIEKFKESQSDQEKNDILNLVDLAPESKYDLVTPELVKFLEQEQNEFIQIRLIRSVGKSSSRLATQILIRFLTHTNHKLLHEVRNQLIQRKAEELIELEELLEHENQDVAHFAAYVLGQLGNRSALPVLIDVLQRTNTSSAQYVSSQQEFQQMQARIWAAKAIGSINDEKSIECLLNVLHTDDSSYVRREAALSLSNLGRQEAIPELHLALNDGLDGRINGIRGLAKLNVEALLWTILQEKSAGWQTAAVELGKLDKAAVLPYLCQALVDLGDESSNEVINLLSELADSDTCHWLVEALDNPEPYEADQYFCNRVALVLVKCRPEVVASQLPVLNMIASRNYIQQIFWIISAIQANCKFYNYEIFQAHQEAQKSDRPNSQNRDRPQDRLR
jgi:HEAT repeat protein